MPDDEWARAVSKVSEYEVTDEIIKDSKELLKETLAGNEEAVSRALDKSHIHVSSNRSYNNEDVLQSAIYLAFIYALNDFECLNHFSGNMIFIGINYDDEKKTHECLDFFGFSGICFVN